MDIGLTREVDYGYYCKRCQYRDKLEEEDPCFECLSNPTNLYSKKPTNYKEDRKEVERLEDEGYDA